MLTLHLRSANISIAHIQHPVVGIVRIDGNRFRQMANSLAFSQIIYAYGSSPTAAYHFYGGGFTVLTGHTLITASKSALIIGRFDPSERTTDIERLRIDQFNRLGRVTLGDRERLGVLEDLSGPRGIPKIREIAGFLPFEVV